VQEIVLMAAAQTSKSEVGNNWTGYVIDNAPGPMLLVQPTVDNVKRYSKQRITPMIQAMPSLASKIIDNKSRESGNTIQEKEFPGGILILGGANSAAGLRSMPIRYLFADEISNWPADVDGEGDPLELAEERTNTFGRKRKVFKCSTPKTKGSCRIEAEYLKTDQRKYFVPCPHCKHMHLLMWCNFIIPEDAAGRKMPTQAHMMCPECGGVIEEHHKTDMLKGGKWIATCPENADPLRVGYWISGLYSPVGWKSWARVARQWLEAQGKPNKLQAFINNVLAETWEERGTGVEDHVLMARAEEYDTSLLPDGVLLLTAGCDVQPNRLEIEVVGWGVGEESWSIDYRVIIGDPNEKLVWQQLDNYLSTEYQHPCGIKLRQARTFIDTAGHNTTAVYDYVRDRGGVGIFGIKGQPGDGKPPVGTPTKSNIGKITLVPLGTFSLKDTVFGRLRIEQPGPGYCHFPKRYTAEYYQQMTAEHVKTKYKKGFAERSWEKKSNDARNEAFDCRNYATGAMLSMQVNFEQLAQMVTGKYDPAPNGRRIRGEMDTGQ
jgi:phage terminase large subunit GpA-like protein